jgi:hypothetical protein
MWEVGKSFDVRSWGNERLRGGAVGRRERRSTTPGRVGGGLVRWVRGVTKKIGRRGRTTAEMAAPARPDPPVRFPPADLAVQRRQLVAKRQVLGRATSAG